MHRDLKLVTWIFILSNVLGGCTGPSYDAAHPVANTLELTSVVDQVNAALTTQNCVGAYNTVYPLYNSSNSNNAIRMAMASTFGCYSHVNLFQLIQDLLSFGGNLNGSGLWEFMVTEFPSTANPDDKVPLAAENGMDALFSVINSGVLVPSSSQVNTTTNNVGSLNYTDRSNDSNSYMTFISMSLMGALLNRGGLPTANHHKSTNLPWTTATAVAGDGCAFASAILSFYDGIQFVVSASTPSVASKYTTIQTFLAGALDAACSAGCTLCGGAVSCTTCPFTLRNRASCTGTATDVNSCAAAGIGFFVNASWTGPP